MREPIFRAVVVALIAMAFLAGGCGGDTQATTTETTGEATTQTTANSTTASSGDAMTVGRKVFIANCSSCHTLADAAATGSIGPNLDDLKPSEPSVESQVE